jgi:hypothetical protein
MKQIRRIKNRTLNLNRKLFKAKVISLEFESFSGTAFVFVRRLMLPVPVNLSKKSTLFLGKTVTVQVDKTSGMGFIYKS